MKILRFTSVITSWVLIATLVCAALSINAGESELAPASEPALAPEPIPASEPAPSAEPSEISLWEAYAKGYATVVSGSNGGLSYIISNACSSTIVIDEYAMIMSPNPYETAPELPDGSRWAQDGILSHSSVAPGGLLTYNYGDYVIGEGLDPSYQLPPPPWFCTEDSEYVVPDVDIALTGEIAPFDLWNTIANPDGAWMSYDRGDGTPAQLTTVTQGAIWTYMRQNAVVIVGKTPMWQSIPNLPTEVDIDIAVTNIGFIAAPEVIVEDRLPPGFNYKAGSFNINPTSITTEPDGTTVLQWNIGSMRGAIQTNDIVPTDYAHFFLSYTMVTPELAPDIRYFLPRAMVDKNNDNSMDSHSEEPLLETYFVNRAPVAQANNPVINEGETAFLDGTASYDPDEPYGDYIVSYEWDLDNDGSMDATGPTLSLAYGDNGFYPMTLRVTDSNGASNSTPVEVTVYNVAPDVEAGENKTANEGSVVSFLGSFLDPGWLDTHTILWDFGDGNTVSGTLSPTHAYGDNGNYTVTLTVTDDDGGVGVDTLTVHVKNVAPYVVGGPDQITDEGSSIFLELATFTDPGWLDTHTAVIDWGDGTVEAGIVNESAGSGTVLGGHTYGDNGIFYVIIVVVDDDGAMDFARVKITVNNVAPSIISYNYTILKIYEPRTIGYWGHQCGVDEPYGEHTGILQEWVDNISTQSQVFSWISTKEDVRDIIQDGDASDMIVMAERQLMGVWLNVVSGKLHPATEIDMLALTSSKTVWEAILEIEDVILNSDNRTELERVKDIADNINNGIGIVLGIVEFTASATDPGADDLTFHWDFGDGKSQDNFYPNPGGVFPISASDNVVHSYFSTGTFTVTLTVTDDDGGSSVITQIITF